MKETIHVHHIAEYLIDLATKLDQVGEQRAVANSSRSLAAKLKAFPDNTLAGFIENLRSAKSNKSKKSNTVKKGSSELTHENRLQATQLAEEFAELRNLAHANKLTEPAISAFQQKLSNRKILDKILALVVSQCLNITSPPKQKAPKIKLLIATLNTSQLRSHRM